MKKELINFSGLFKERIRFVDFTKSPEQYMAASDIFVLPSYREGFGSVVVEAASCGLPAICSNIYGLSDSIKAEDTGLLVPARSAHLLEGAMLKLIDNKKMRNEMSINARKRVVNHFSQDNITSQILRLYEGLEKK